MCPEVPVYIYTVEPPPLGPVKVSLLEGWPHFRGEFAIKSMLWDISKWRVATSGGPD